MRAPLFSLVLVASACTTNTPAPDAYLDDVGTDAHRDPEDAFVVPHDIGPDVSGDVGPFDAGSDAALVDTAVDASPPCSPDGTYGVTWVAAATNPAGCLTPGGSL